MSHFNLPSNTLRRAMIGFVLSVLPGIAVAQGGSDALAPTASENPGVIDQIWQKSVSKYDSERAKVLQDVDKVNASGPFRPDWESLKNYKVPDWYKDAKFGIFIHWGVYAVPAFGSEWYPRLMYIEGSEENQHHLATYGSLDKFGYKDFVPLFKAEKFDPKAWAQLFKEAGAKYVVPVFEHHDGFQMYDSALSDWTAVKMGPQRDLMGDLAKAVREQGMHFGASSHRVEHNFFMGVGRKVRSDVNDPKNASLYGPAHNWIEPESGTPIGNDFTYVSPEWTRDWLARCAEFVQKYHPDFIFFDWWIGQPSVREDLTRFATFYYNESLRHGGPVGVITYKYYAMNANSGVLDIERGQLSDIRPEYWQTDTSVSNKSWGYIEHDTFKTPEFIVQQLADIVSKNGNLLMNIGPRADGTIPDEVQQVLRGVGSWLKVNGNAIYGTRPWRVFGEGPTKVTEGAFNDTNLRSYTPLDFRFTSRGKTLYAIELGWPTKPEAVIKSIATPLAGEGPVDSVELMGAGKLQFSQKDDGLHIQLPSQKPGEYAYVYKISFKGD
jgi:alpha-L-fucosidase